MTVSLVPSEPPAYVVNSAVVDENGSFSMEIIVPSDPRWLDESPVPVLVQLEDGTGSAQAMFTIIATPGDAALTPVPVTSPTPAQPTATPQPPAQGVPQATVNAYALNVRTGPGNEYPSLGQVPRGTILAVVGISPDREHYVVNIPTEIDRSGRGWVPARYVRTENVSSVPVVQPPPVP